MAENSATNCLICKCVYYTMPSSRHLRYRYPYADSSEQKRTPNVVGFPSTHACHFLARDSECNHQRQALCRISRGKDRIKHSSQIDLEQALHIGNRLVPASINNAFAEVFRLQFWLCLVLESISCALTTVDLIPISIGIVD